MPYRAPLFDSLHPEHGHPPTHTPASLISTKPRSIVATVIIFSGEYPHRAPPPPPNPLLSTPASEDYLDRLAVVCQATSGHHRFQPRPLLAGIDDAAPPVTVSFPSSVLLSCGGEERRGTGPQRAQPRGQPASHGLGPMRLWALKPVSVFSSESSFSFSDFHYFK